MITSGTILMEKDALCPPFFHLTDDSSPNAWMSVTHDFTPRAFSEELSAAGWTFFYIASAMRATAFGFNRAKMIRAALKRIITNVRERKCNSLEIDGVAMHSFLGMPYVSVSAHPRHIQKGLVFAGR